ncbi:chorismate mutase [Serratia fonticola]|uniref:chorismate mutase n=1 Tax=Serratia fonticola TaxID=47917 RepID=A0A542BRY6_SERFO|nr:chorismate mutase [Serratia fonticola]TQI81267.1 chorismate mutase [Serratia fonticola]TQI96709.1 chorismate mutase [Serratia fonticola]TVZ71205.1 chorismate mutase [Serratia fonticola]
MRKQIKSRDAPVSRFRAIRGAVQIPLDKPELIAIGTSALITQLINLNDLQPSDLISFLFTVTPDLTSELPPLVAQEAGWEEVPMLCAAELPTRMMIPRVIRLLVHVNWRNSHREPLNVYLPGTTAVRPKQIDRVI